MSIRLLLAELLQRADCVRLGYIYESIDTPGDAKKRRDRVSDGPRIASFELYLCKRKLFRRRNVLVDRAKDLETTARK